MKFLHLLNGTLWLANAVTWAFYAHSTPMAITSLGAAVASVWAARNEA